MVSMVRPRQDDVPDDLLVVESPSLRERPNESRFSDHPLLTERPSFGRRFSRALVRFLVPCCIGVAATLAWQSYGDAARQTVATFAAQHGWPISWLSYQDVATPNSPPRPETTQSAPATQTAPELATDLQQLKTMTLGLAATLTTMRERVEQLAARQKDTANDIAQLQAAEQEIQHKIATLLPRPAAAAPSKPTTAPQRALTPPR